MARSRSAPEHGAIVATDSIPHDQSTDSADADGSDAVGDKQPTAGAYTINPGDDPETAQRRRQRFHERISQDTAPSQEEALEHTLAWSQATLRLEDLSGQDVVSPLHAAMLLCGLNPFAPEAHAMWHDSEVRTVLPGVDGGKDRAFISTPEDHAAMLSYCESVEGKHSLQKWYSMAKRKGRKIHPWIEDHFAPMVKPALTPVSERQPPMPWKMEVQAIAAELWTTLRRAGANPTVNAIIDEVAKRCADRGIKTSSGINPNANYLRTHVLSAKHWTPPPDARRE